MKSIIVCLFLTNLALLLDYKGDLLVILWLLIRWSNWLWLWLWLMFLTNIRLSLSLLATPFLNSLTLSAYLRVLRVCSQQLELGEMLPIITDLQSPPTKLSFNTRVNLFYLKGIWVLSISNALIHSFRANNDLLISAPSIRVYLCISVTSLALSFPAKSMNDNLPTYSTFSII